MGSPGKVRVLCIEDERLLLDDLHDELRAAGYEVSVAESAQRAFEQLDAFTPDLILCDVMLGGDDAADGYAVLRHVREQRPDLAITPFIFLTALGERDDLLQAKLQGVDDYLVKPVDYDLLLATLAARLQQVDRLKGTRRNSRDEQAERLRSVLSQLPGAVLLCDGHGQLLYANQRSQHLLQEQALWRVNSAGTVIWPHAMAESVRQLHLNLQQMSAEPGEARRVQTLEMRNSGDNALVSLIKIDCRDAATDAAGQLFVLFICNAQSRPVPDEEALRMLFGLTRTEAKVARLLALGKRSEEVAETLFVSATTVAFHLRNLFQKTGVSRQSDLVALVLAAGWTLPNLGGEQL
ncbi:response regulator [Pseudomonas wenzhouensis]|uniref:response regulator n=1 Tax=Pseudomonas wenzhouensis TaxID=2906062 RepID=UPI001E483B1A|nr:response regulator [Pseudomonas wenzhouensis]UFQ97182.1 response regulator [Pseudomonas wenzhouensis]